ncbi:MAG: universal stress protein [Planctomycetota bacterium]|nr:universal stress protein [Planctomycetota bacterium]MDA0970335.1 universal stress protein [Planctomycetota bacterium]
MIKRILVGVGTSQTARSVAAHAVELGQHFEAELLGVAVTDPLRLEWTGPRPIGMGVEAVTAELREERLQRAKADVAAAKAIFSDRCRADGVEHCFSEQVGDPFEIVGQLVRYQDMCVFGLRGLFEHDVVPEPRDALERLVASGVRPILAVSEEYRPIKKVLVAYSGSLESAKTFKNFVLSGLFPEAVIRVVNFSSNAAAALGLLDHAAAYFRSHRREVDTDHVAGDPQQELVPYATTWGADLIVAGNSAKNLLMRRLFGETALMLLRESPLPLYLSQ